MGRYPIGSDNHSPPLKIRQLHRVKFTSSAYSQDHAFGPSHAPMWFAWAVVDYDLAWGWHAAASIRKEPKPRTVNMKNILLILLLLALPVALFGENISGTYVGVAKTEMPDGTREASFTIILKEDGAKFFVTGAPTGADQLPATVVGRSGNSLRFQLTPPGKGEEPVKFDVAVKNGKMTGKMIVVKAGRIIDGTLNLSKK